MEWKKFKHNAEKVKAMLVKKNGQIITKQECFILVPEGYVSKGLLHVGNVVNTLGVFAIFCNELEYGVSTATAMMNLGDCVIEIIEIDEVNFYKFTFLAGSVVIANTAMVRENKLPNYILDFFVDYGKSPWFMTYMLIAELLSRSKYFNDIKLGINQSVLDVIASSIARDTSDVTKYYRHVITKPSELFMRPMFVPLRDITLNTSSNLARLNGSELQRGLKAALLSEDNRSEPLEDIILS